MAKKRPTFTAVAIFCDSIRAEVGGTESIIGSLPDLVVLQGATEGISIRLSIYVRFNFRTNSPPTEVNMFLREQGKEDTIVGRMEKSVIDAGQKNAIRDECDIFSVGANIVSPNYTPTFPSRIYLMVEVDGYTEAAGTIWFSNVVPPGVRQGEQSVGLETFTRPTAAPPSKRTIRRRRVI